MQNGAFLLVEVVWFAAGQPWICNVPSSVAAQPVPMWVRLISWVGGVVDPGGCGVTEWTRINLRDAERNCKGVIFFLRSAAQQRGESASLCSVAAEPVPCRFRRVKF